MSYYLRDPHLISRLHRLSTGLRSTRAFFTLPDLTSLSPFPQSNTPPQTQTYHERKIFPYRRSQLYDVVADVGSYPRFVPFCTGSRVLSTYSQPEKPGELSMTVMDAELTVGFISYKESYVSRVTCKPFESVEAVASSSTPLFKTLVTTWRFQPASSESPHSRAGDVLSKKYDAHAQGSKAANDCDSCSTLVTLDLAFAFANPLYATVSAAFFGQVSQLMVKAFAERCLAVYGPGCQ